MAKDEEFPNIDWSNLEDPDIQKAELIYSDRINTFRRLVAIEREIDNNPTELKISDFVELSIRNRLCREELTSFNNKGHFLGQHPIIAENKFHKEMSELLKNNPDEFMRKLKNAQLNIGRYSSYIRDPRKRAAVDTNTEKLNHWQFKLNIMSSILKDSLNG